MYYLQIRHRFEYLRIAGIASDTDASFALA